MMCKREIEEVREKEINMLWRKERDRKIEK